MGNPELAEPQSKRSWWKLPWLWFGGVLVVVVLVPVGLFAASVASYVLSTTHYVFPADPLVPPSATTLVSERGSDNDDPIRLVVSVIDAAGLTEPEVVAAYRAAYPASDGWTELSPASEEILLCLTRTDGDAAQIVELWPYTGARVPQSDNHYTAMRSNIYWREGPPAPLDPSMCGYSFAWVSMDLFDS